MPSHADKETFERVNQIAEPYRGFLPEGFAFCCPHCMCYKAFPATVMGIRGILCKGPTEVPSGYDPTRLVLCGKFTTALEVTSFKDMRMVQE